MQLTCAAVKIGAWESTCWGLHPCDGSQAVQASQENLNKKSS